MSAAQRPKPLGVASREEARRSRGFRNELLYTGRRIDPETGLQLNRHRFYHQQLGRWVSRDPIGYWGKWLGGGKWAVEPSLFSYNGSSPLHFIDPYGLFLSWPTWEEYLAYLDFTDDSYEIDILPGGDYVVGGATVVAGTAGTAATGMLVVGATGPIIPGTAGWALPGFGWSARGAAIASSTTRAAKTLDPFLGKGSPAGFGRLINWGRGPVEAASRAKCITCEELAAIGMTPEVAKYWLDFYAQAMIQGRGDATAAERFKLMSRILELLRKCAD